MSDPIEIQVVRFVCPHCRRGHSKRKACAGHISRCFSNPENQACKTCLHYERGLAGSYEDPPEPESCGWGNGESIPRGCSAWISKQEAA